MQLCMFLSTVDASLNGLHISLGLASEELLGVSWWGGLSYHSVYTRLMERLQYYHWFFLCLQGYFPTPWPFGKNLRTPLRSQGLLFLVFSVWHFSGGGQSWQQNISPAKFCASYWVVYFRSIFLAIFFLVVGFSSMYKMNSLLRAPLHSWGALWWFNVSNIFG